MPTDPKTDSDDRSKGVDPSILWMLWSVMLASFAIYGAFPFFSEPQEPMTGDTLRILVIALSVVSLAEVPVVWLLRKIMYHNRLESGDFTSLEEVGQTYFIACIVTWAIAESIAIYGFVLTFLSGRYIYFVPFAALGAILMIIFRPDLDTQIETYQTTSAE